jgi:hypothetical protein
MKLLAGIPCGQSEFLERFLGEIRKKMASSELKTIGGMNFAT